jgi:hypothetical protein
LSATRTVIAALLFGLAGYLIYQAFKPSQPLPPPPVKGTVTITFVISNKAGQPLQGVVIRLTGTQAISTAFVPYDQTITTDATGTATFLGVPQWEIYNVSISATGYATVNTTLNVASFNQMIPYTLG